MSTLSLVSLIVAAWVAGWIITATVALFVIKDREAAMRAAVMLAFWWPALAPVAAVIWLVFGAATLLEKVVRRLRARMTGPAQ